MSFRKGAAQLLQNCSDRHRTQQQRFLSKVWGNFSKLNGKLRGNEKNEFCSRGWTGGASLSWNYFLQRHNLRKEGFKLREQHVRFLRSGRGETPKNQRNVFPALEDAGARMSGIPDILIKPAIFTAFVAGGSFIGSTIWQYETHRNKIRGSGSFTGAGAFTSSAEENKRFEFRNAIRLWWKKATAAEKIFWPICAVNALVFTAWHMPGLSTRMVTYFTATPVSRAVCWPMLLSTFSHYSIFHLGANMFVLHSFLPAAISLMGPEQFLSTYVSAGVISSFGSHLHKIFVGSNVPSLGASGAIMGILGYVCMKMPDTELGIIFIPGLTFSADTAIKCILAVDTVGLIAGWRLMDHAAHLSGALFGIGLCYFENGISRARDKIMRIWHTIRNV